MRQHQIYSRWQPRNPSLCLHHQLKKRDRIVGPTYLFTAASSPWNFGLCDLSLLDFKIPLTLPCLSAIVVGNSNTGFIISVHAPLITKGRPHCTIFASKSVQEDSESDECYSVQVHSRCCAGLERERYVCESEPFDFTLHDVAYTLKMTLHPQYLCVVRT